MKKILFRADAAPHIGIGDLMSLINISKYLDKTYEKYFIIKNNQAAIHLVDKHRIEKCFFIDSGISLQDEKDYINHIINECAIDIIFFEITERKLSEYVGIDKKVKKIAVNFDGNILDDLDLVIDWDVDAYKYFTPENYPNTRFLLGYEYVILPIEFYYKKVLVAMGGADEFDLTGRVADVLIKSDLNIELNIVVGPGYGYSVDLKNKLMDSSVKHNIKYNVTNMLDEYLSCDIGIGAGGLTSSEMVATKKNPPILIATYKHQIARCEFFEMKGWAQYLGYREFGDSDLLEAIKKIIVPQKEHIFNTWAVIDEIKKI